MKKIHRGWLVFAALAIIWGCSNGIMTNCLGVIFAGIIAETGYKTSQLSLFYTVRSLVGALIIGSMYKKFLAVKRRNLFVCMMGALCSLSFVMMTFFTAAWQWNIAAVVFGVGVCLLGMMIPTIINNWFHKHRGLLVASSFTLAGFSAAIFSPICADIIEKWGWRAACWVVAVLGIIFWILPAYFFVNLTPEELGLKPYGSEDAEAAAAFDFESAKRYDVPVSVFFCVFIPVLTVAALTNLGPQLAVFATSSGYSLAIGATVTTFSMIGNFVFKLLMGVLSDRLGAVRSAMIFAAVLAVGFVLILAGLGSPAVICLGSLLYGTSYAIGTSSPSLTLREVYGDAEYGEKLRVYHVCSSICGMMATVVFPLVYDVTGSWVPDFVFGMIAGVLCAGMLFYVLRYLRRRRPIGVSEAPSSKLQ